MHATVYLAFGLLTLGQVEAPQAKSGPAAVTKKVDFDAETKRLVKLLDADDSETRENAEKELVSLGAEALAYLPRVGPKDSAELKNRLQRVREALEKVASSGFFKPAIVNLEGSMQLSVAVAKIEEQTGNALVDFRERYGQEAPNPTLKLAIKDATFWEAVDQICDQANLEIEMANDEEDGLPFITRTEGSSNRVGRGQYAGLFRLEPTTVETTRDLRQPNQNSLRLLTNIAWEPRIKPIVLEAQLGDIKVEDEGGKDIALDESQGPIVAEVEGIQQATELTFYLNLPSRESKKIGKLNCKMTALVPGRIETFEFDKLSKARNEKVQRGDVAVTIEQTRKIKELFEIRLLVEYAEGSQALESHRGWVFSNPAYMLDPAGNQIEIANSETTTQDDNAVGFAFRFDLSGVEGDLSKCKFVYKTPSALIKVPVEIELKDIELP
jgi:hypothetical protein